jgi:hypothetical protein
MPKVVNNLLPPLSEEHRISLGAQIDEAVKPLEQSLRKREETLSDLYDEKEIQLGMTSWSESPFGRAQRSMSFYIRGDIIEIQALVAEGNLAAAILTSKKFAENTNYILAKVDAFIEKALNATSVEELEKDADLN